MESKPMFSDLVLIGILVPLTLGADNLVQEEEEAKD